MGSMASRRVKRGGARRCGATRGATRAAWGETVPLTRGGSTDKSGSGGVLTVTKWARPAREGKTSIWWKT